MRELAIVCAAWLAYAALHAAGTRGSEARWLGRASVRLLTRCVGAACGGLAVGLAQRSGEGWAVAIVVASATLLVVASLLPFVARVAPRALSMASAAAASVLGLAWMLGGLGGAS